MMGGYAFHVGNLHSLFSAGFNRRFHVVTQREQFLAPLPSPCSTAISRLKTAQAVRIGVFSEKRTSAPEAKTVQ